MTQPPMPSPVTPTITLGKLRIHAPPSVTQPALRASVLQYSDWIQWADTQSRYDAPDQGTYRSMYTQSSVMQQALTSSEATAGSWEKNALLPGVLKSVDVSEDSALELGEVLLQHARVMSSIGACWNPADQKWQMIRPVYGYDLLRFSYVPTAVESYGADHLTHILQSKNVPDARKFGVEVPKTMLGLYGKVDPTRWRDFSVLTYVSSMLCPVVLALKSARIEILSALTFQDVQTLLSSRCSADMRVSQWSTRTQSAGSKQVQVIAACDSGVKKTQNAVFSYLSSEQSNPALKPQVHKWLDESTQRWAKDLDQSGPCLSKIGRGGHCHVLSLAVLAMAQDPSVIVSKWVGM